MSDKRPAPGKKISYQKVATACFSCRSRRVKCSESKPSCIQCLDRSLLCCYDDKTQIGSDTSPPALIVDFAVVERSVFGSPAQGDYTVDRALSFYRERTSRIFSGVFFGPYIDTAQSAAQPAHSLRAVIPPFALQNEVARHLSAAIAFRHEMRDRDAPPNCLYNARFNYTKALSLFQNAIYDMDAGSILLCILMCAVYTNVAEDDSASAMIHLRHGITVLRGPTMKTSGPSLAKLLYTVFGEIAMASAVFAGPIPGSDSACSVAQARLPDIPDSLRDLSQARSLFYDILSWRYWYVHVSESRTEALEEAVEKTRSLFAAWRQLLIDFQLTCEGDLKLKTANFLFQYDSAASKAHHFRTVPFMDRVGVEMLSYNLTERGIDATFTYDGDVAMMRMIQTPMKPDADVAAANITIWPEMTIHGSLNGKVYYKVRLRP